VYKSRYNRWNTVNTGESRSPVLGASLPRRAPGPREQEPLFTSPAPPPTMDVYHECATEGCAKLVCNGGDRQNVQSPYCSNACWYEHVRDGRVHGASDTKAWADDTTRAIWGRGRLREVHIAPRSVGAMQMDIRAGGPLRTVFEQQWRGQAELLRQSAQAIQALTGLQQGS
jgi:hypothetical protein